MRCPAPGPKTTTNERQYSSSLSSQTVHPGDKVTYVVTFARIPSHPAGYYQGYPLPAGVPQNFYCTNAIACTINGVPAIGSGNGPWQIDTNSASFQAFNDRDDRTTSQWTYTVVFTLHSSNVTCNGTISYTTPTPEWYESWPVTISTLELDEDERNKRDRKNKKRNGQTFTCDGDGGCTQYSMPNSDQPPASMGWGWSMPLNKSVKVDPNNNDIIFYDGSGSFERWEKVGSDYVARYADNYATLTKVGSGPVVITTKDKSVLTFRTSDGKIATEVDRNGNTTTYNYDPTSGWLTSVSDGEGRVVYLNYGSRTDGQPVSIRQQNATTGRLTTYDYQNDRLWKVTNPNGEVTTFLYNAQGLLWKQIDPRGQTLLEYTYANGKIATETIYGERRITYSYATGDNGSVITTTVEEDLTLTPSDPAPRTTVQTFDRFSNLIKNVDPLGNIWTYQYKDTRNPYLLTEEIDPNGATTSYAYDANGNLVSTTDAMGNTTTMTYTEGYLLASIQRPSVTVEGVLTTYPPTVLDYDLNGNLESVTDVLNGNSVATTFSLRPDGRISSVTNRVGQVTQFEYTTNSGGLNAGNLKKIILPGGPNSAPAREILFTYNAYDERIKTTDAGGNEIDFEFDDGGRLTKVTDALNHELVYHYTNGLMDYMDLPANQGSSGNSRRTRFTHDNPGRVLQVLSKINATTEEMRVRYEYDGRSNLKKLARLKRNVSNAVVEKAYTFEHDILDRPFEALDPLGGLTTTQHDPHCKSFTVTSARGVTTKVSRDSLCRVTEIDNSDEIREFVYDELSRLVSVVQTHNPEYRYTNPSNPVQRPARFGQARYSGATVVETTSYLYDSWDRLVKVTYPDNKVMEYEYDLESRVTKMTDMLGKVTEYTHYNDGRLYQVKAKATPADQVFTYSYDLAGRPYEIQFPTSTGIVARYYTTGNVSGWDANGRLTHLRYTKGSNLLQSFTYAYDPSGNRTSMVETPASGPAITWAYGYDWLDRLTSVTKDSVLQSVYSYDESDNRIQLQMPVLSQTHSYAYDFADRILSRSVNGSSVETFSHDADGNMIARTAGGVTTTYNWNDDNRLISISKPGLSASYRYDSEGIRKSKGSDTRYFSSGAASLADLHPTNSISYIQGHQILGMIQAGSFYWYISDALSTVRLVVDGTGTVVASYGSDEFGNQTAATGSADLRQHTYTGGLGVRDDGNGLYYARQRYFDPALGKWLSADPIGFDGGLNLHAYVGNNPPNFVDPSGLIELYPDENQYPSEELKAFRKEYNWPNCTTVQMHNQIEWENNPWNQNTLHILRGRPMFPGRRIGTGRPNVGYPSGRVNSRPLLPSDMNFRGTPNILNGRVTEPLKGGTYRVHVDMMDGTIANPYRTIPQLAGAARRAGAGSLECSGTFANERLMNFVEKSGGKITTTITDRGPVDSFRIELP